MDRLLLTVSALGDAVLEFLFGAALFDVGVGFGVVVFFLLAFVGAG